MHLTSASLESQLLKAEILQYFKGLFVSIKIIIKKLKIELHYDPEIQLLSIHPEKIII